MKVKFECIQLVKSHVSPIQTQFHKTVKTIKSDNGLKNLFKDVYLQNGIHH